MALNGMLCLTISVFLRLPSFFLTFSSIVTLISSTAIRVPVWGLPSFTWISSLRPMFFGYCRFFCSGRPTPGEETSSTYFSPNQPSSSIWCSRKRLTFRHVSNVTPVSLSIKTSTLLLLCFTSIRKQSEKASSLNFSSRRASIFLSITLRVLYVYIPKRGNRKFPLSKNSILTANIGNFRD